MRSWGGERMQRAPQQQQPDQHQQQQLLLSADCPEISIQSDCKSLRPQACWRLQEDAKGIVPNGRGREGARGEPEMVKPELRSGGMGQVQVKRLNVRLCGLEAKETRLTDRPRSVLRRQRPATLWRDSCSQSSSTICARSRKA